MANGARGSPEGQVVQSAGVSEQVLALEAELKKAALDRDFSRAGALQLEIEAQQVVDLEAQLAEAVKAQQFDRCSALQTELSGARGRAAQHIADLKAELMRAVQKGDFVRCGVVHTELCAALQAQGHGSMPATAMDVEQAFSPEQVPAASQASAQMPIGQALGLSLIHI